VTLAEAVVVITLIGLLAGFSIPRFLEPTPASTVTEEAELLAWTVRLARYRAITLSQRVYVEFEPNGTTNSYTAYISATDTASNDGNRPVPRRRGLRFSWPGVLAQRA
jgi:Tfp pilus assembly protein FimT